MPILMILDKLVPLILLLLHTHLPWGGGFASGVDLITCRFQVISILKELALKIQIRVREAPDAGPTAVDGACFYH